MYAYKLYEFSRVNSENHCICPIAQKMRACDITCLHASISILSPKSKTLLIVDRIYFK